MSFLLNIKLRSLFDLNCIQVKNIYNTRLHTIYLLMSRIRLDICIKATNKNYYIKLSE